MGGALEPWTWLAATSSAGALWVLLLFAYRRIPKQPSPDDIQALRYDFEALVDQFQDFVQTHDQAMASSYAKVGRLRGKLRRLQEEEGLDPEDFDGEETGSTPTTTPVTPFMSRGEQKKAVRQHFAAKTGA